VSCDIVVRMTVSLRDRALSWIAADPDPSTAAELRAIVDAGDEKELAERMAGPLEFGTAGLRGVIGAGESRMNRAVIRRTSAGLAAYLIATVPNAASKGVVIGYDGRRFSREFAEDTALVLAAAGIVSHLFEDVAPTPLTAFATVHLSAAAGVMVTASHNPPEYNGYKVYWADGAQIIPPHDIAIAEAIVAIGPANQVALAAMGDARAKGLVRDVAASVRATYLDEVAALSIDRRGRELTRIVYTPLHGVGDVSTREALRRFGFDDVASVPEQQKPDGEFPTVAFPNPEEKGALDLSFALARSRNANLILANDPDADRLAVAIREPDGSFRQLTGNEVGVLMAEYLLRKTAADGAKRLVMTTIVSSPMLGHMAAKLGVGYGEVLTGFKWIATGAMKRDASEGAKFLFGYEEALGYTVKTVARDKDGVGAAAVFAEIFAVAAAEGSTIQQELERLARTYGLFVSTQVNVTRKGVSGPAEIGAIMEHLRATNPASIGAFSVDATRDVKKGTKTSSGATSALDLPSSNVIIYDLAGGARVIARPSGTEPKIKFYFDLREEVASGETFETARQRALGRLDQLKAAFLSLVG
jgi:phosphomannomutase